MNAFPKLLYTLLIMVVCLPAVNAQHVARAAKSVGLATGITMHYREAGTPGNEVVIMLHGYTDSGRSFYPAIDSLQVIFPGLHIFAPDQRGHGRSTMPAAEGCAEDPAACFEITDFAADVIAFMDALHITKAHLVGHSMGSMVAQEIALSYPARIKSVCLIGASANCTNNPVVREFLIRDTIEGLWKQSLTRQPGFRWPQDAYLLTPLDADPDAEAWLTGYWVADPTANPAFVRSIVPETARVPLGAWYGAILSIQKFDCTERLRNLTVPVFVLWATQDNMFLEKPEQQNLLASLAQAARAHGTPYYFKPYGAQPLPASGFQENDFGHNLQWGAPGAVARDIAAFIRTGEPTATLYYANPHNLRECLSEKGKALVQSANR